MIRNIYLVLVPVSGSELLKSLEFPKRKRAKNVILYVNGVILDHIEGWGLVAKTILFSATPPDLHGGERS